MRPIDLHHLGQERVIACWEVDGLLVDPGPESCVQTLLGALDGARPRAILLTHIHFDHAGATGALVREWPDVPVYVHERGFRHLVDPERLVASARRLYGEDFDRLWGEVIPVPEANLRSLSGGETVEGFEVAYTPGHASHHVCYRHIDSTWAFVGDVAGVRIAPAEFVLAPTPPPDIDVDAWNESVRTVAAWNPAGLALTHFGAVESDVFSHLEAVRQSLTKWATLAKAFDPTAFVEELHAEVVAHTGGDEETVASYEQAAPPEQLYLGLERYWRQRDGA